MKRLSFLIAAPLACLALSATGASATTAGPADYRPECETMYQAFKPGVDVLVENARAPIQAIELALCGENRHS